MGMIYIMKKIKILIIILIVILVITPFVYVQANKIIYKNRVTNYLIESQNYSEEEIEVVKGIWGKMLPSFFAVVIFKDEPYVEYIYFAHDEVLQFDHRLTQEGIERGIIMSELKHYVPLDPY